ncbi:heat-inducible transcriptional repressor HrcA [Oceanicoccus sagamiensis]|uniref:Heat-inducible transcription repressor HrcA n=1 Tax=Oceanicoccus sagamiensis TaxID=716816 RepID=A0A1X9N599_9GAMM|nr:heat-inducible transcriptional repressor HrcA [Oceanicoccus sagamiensis]ARN73288.1 heat-inducible transcription repressor HrcA [Oceanicoccus sagamiensis]
MTADIVTERAQLLLKTLVERYIRDGQPVGSRSLLDDSGLPVSPATVRNVMSDLEERGLITSPHTSAGRIPTTQGYRLFVDSLITMQPITDQAIHNLELELDPDKSPTELVQTASQLLSSITSQAGLVTVPKPEKQALRQVEFLPLSGNRVLVILVINEREVQNRVVHTAREYSEIELQQATLIVNQRYAGKGLAEIRRGVVAAMQQDKDSIDSYMQTTLDLASKAFEQEDEGSDTEYVVAGESQLVSATSAEDMERLQELFAAFEQKKDILDLVDRSLQAEGVQIFIGEEAGYDMMGGFSLITAPYQTGGDNLGMLGVIGPTRMAYEQVIPMVDITAQILSLALKKS